MMLVTTLLADLLLRKSDEELLDLKKALQEKASELTVQEASVSELQNEVNKLIRLREENESLKRDLSIVQTELRQTRDAHDSESQELNEQLAQARRDASKAEKEVARIRESSKVSRARNVELQRELGSLRQEQQDLQMTVDSLKQGQPRMQKEQADLLVQLGTWKANCHKVETERDAVKGEKIAMENQVKEFSEIIDRIKQENQETNEKIEGLMAELEGTKSVARKREEELQKQLGALSQELGEFKTRSNALEKELHQAMGLTTQVETQLKQTTSNLDAVKSENGQLTAELDQLRLSYHDTMQEHERVMKLKMDQIEKLETSLSTNSDEEELEFLRREVIEKDEHITHLNASRNEALRALHMELEEMQKERDAALTALSQSRADAIEKLHAEIEVKEKERIDALTALEQSRADAIEKLHAEIELRETEMAKMKKEELMELGSRMKQLENENTNLREELVLLRGGDITLQAENEELKLEVESLKELLVQKDQEFEEKVTMLEKSRTSAVNVLHSQLEENEASFEEKIAELERSRTDAINALRQTMDDLETNLTDKIAQVESSRTYVTTTLHERIHELEEENQMLKSFKEKFEAADSDLAALSAELTSTRVELESLRSENEAILSQLKTRSASTEVNTQLKAEYDVLVGDLREAHDQIDALRRGILLLQKNEDQYNEIIETPVQKGLVVENAHQAVPLQPIESFIENLLQMEEASSDELLKKVEHLEKEINEQKQKIREDASKYDEAIYKISIWERKHADILQAHDFIQNQYRILHKEFAFHQKHNYFFIDWSKSVIRTLSKI